MLLCGRVWPQSKTRLHQGIKDITVSIRKTREVQETVPESTIECRITKKKNSNHIGQSEDRKISEDENSKLKQAHDEHR